VQDFFSPLKIFGRNGKNLIEMWDNDRPYSYYGIVSRDTPNAFMILGPNTVSRLLVAKVYCMTCTNENTIYVVLLC